MRKLLWILPFVAVLALLGSATRIAAYVAGELYIPLNVSLEGARILEHRARLAEGIYPPGYMIYFAGTSRTMADFNPGIVTALLNRRCDPAQPITAYNLGNVADDYGSFYAALQHFGAPRLLVLELMPNVLLESRGTGEAAAPEPDSWQAAYRDYKLDTSIFEDEVTGRVESWLGLDDLVRLAPGELVILARTLANPDHRFARVYYALRNFQGFGFRMADGGQVYYHSYLPDSRAAALSGQSASQLESDAVQLRAPPSDREWQDFVRILDLFGPRHDIVVVRAPVDPTMLALEQREHGDLMAKAVQYLASRGIPYIDLNPGTYHSTDYSHIDWYDTARLSRDFAARLAAVVHPETLGATACH